MNRPPDQNSIVRFLQQERRKRLMTERLLALKTAEAAALRQDLRADAYRLAARLDSQRRVIEAERLAAELKLCQSAQDAQRQADIAEERLRVGIDTIRDGFAIFNAAQELVLANHSYLRTFRAFKEVRPGIPFARILEICAYQGVVDLGQDDPGAWILSMLARWEQQHIPECVLHFSAGHSARLFDRRAANGDVVSLVSDITLTLRQQAELEGARARAEAASRAKSAFLAIMSHEIRTPMNGVVGMAELLSETDLTDDQRLYVQTIRSSGEALLEIIGDVLDYSRIEADKLTLAPAPFDLERCIHEVLVLLQPSARAQGLALVLDYDPLTPVRLMGDALRIRQIMLNLVGNAIKFTETGHVLVRVAGRSDADGQNCVTITVEDTGIGIAPAAQARIFDEFSQVEQAHNRKFDGTGLGLAITRRLVTLMGGRIQVDSEPGKGARFAVGLPLPVVEPAAAPGAWPLVGDTALIFDARAVEGEILRDQLQAMRLDATLCTSPQAFAEQLASAPEPADIIVIADSNDPEQRQTLTGLIATAGSAATTVLLSDNPAALMSDGSAAGFDAVLQIPVLRRDLLAQLKRLAPAQRPASPPESTGSMALRQMRVLSAEDNRTNRLVFCKMVKSLDIDLQFAKDGAEAVAKFRSFAPDLIFMDISMPGMDGCEATRLIRSDPAGYTVPVIALTAHVLEGEEASFKRRGLTEYQTKPLRKAEILDTIRRHRPIGARPVDPPDRASGNDARAATARVAAAARPSRRAPAAGIASAGAPAASGAAKDAP